MNRPNLNQPSDLWLVDGSLRDVYVFDTDLTDWEMLVTLARSQPHKYSRDGVVHELPNARTLFQDREHSHLLSVQAGKASISCHFFVPDEIELDIDPRGIAGPEEHESVLQFIEQLAEATRKEVVVTAENSPKATLLRYEHRSSSWQIYELRPNSDA